MAKKSSSQTKGSAKSDNTVVRIKASDSAPKKEKDIETKPTKAEKPATTSKPEKKSRKARGGKFFGAIGGYFKGAWVELRQVRWPNRRATWSLTGAVLLYTAFFVILVLLLDALFKYLFELILGK